MQELEISGKNVEQAIQRALEKLGLDREQVDIDILSEGKPGILGLGGEEAWVRVSVLAPDGSEESDVARIARDVLSTLLARMEISATIAQVDDDPVTFNIRGDDLGILIGRRGQTLTALQYLVRIMVSRRAEEWSPMVIDVEGYKQRRYLALQALANRMAERVITRRAPFTMEPMPAYERRIIHLTLADHPGVKTQSVGEGEERKVVIMVRS